MDPCSFVIHPSRPLTALDEGSEARQFRAACGRTISSSLLYLYPGRVALGAEGSRKIDYVILSSLYLVICRIIA
jgi:hypothetical protein